MNKLRNHNRFPLLWRICFRIIFRHTLNESLELTQKFSLSDSEIVCWMATKISLSLYLKPFVNISNFFSEKFSLFCYNSRTNSLLFYHWSLLWLGTALYYTYHSEVFWFHTHVTAESLYRTGLSNSHISHNLVFLLQRLRYTKWWINECQFLQHFFE